MGYCKKCGSQYEGEYRFCPNCGNDTAAVPAQTPNASPVQSQYAPPAQPQFSAPVKKKNKPMTAVVCILVAVIVLACIGIAVAGGGSSATQSFSCQELNMEIPLFMEEAGNDPLFADYTFVLDSTRIAVFGLREPVSDLGEMTLAEYTQLVIDINGFTCPIREYEDHCEFTFTNSGTTFQVYTYKSDSAYWMLQFTGTGDDYIADMAASVNFD